MFKYGGGDNQNQNIHQCFPCYVSSHPGNTVCNTLIITSPQHYLLISNIDDI